MMSIRKLRESGQVEGRTIALVILTILFIGVTALSIWLFINYTEQKTDVDMKIEAAVAKAEKSQADADEKKFAEREKEPNNQFVGPEDYGRVTFNYPKTWSVYVNSNVVNGGKFEAYLHPLVVPKVSATEQFALRVVIEENSYDKVIATYSKLIDDGSLKSSSFSANGASGMRFDGNFTKDIRGSAVVMKIRDKTLTIRSDANTFKADFDALVTTIKFNS